MPSDRAGMTKRNKVVDLSAYPKWAKIQYDLCSKFTVCNPLFIWSVDEASYNCARSRIPDWWQ